jgi:hypothetical protein
MRSSEPTIVGQAPAFGNRLVDNEVLASAHDIFAKRR